MKHFFQHGALRLMALLVSISFLVACSQGTPTSQAPTAASAPAPTAASAPAPTAASEPAAATILGTLEIHGIDLAFQPKTLNVEKPGRYTVKLINDGAIQHDITFPNGTKIVANSKETKSADIDVPAEGLSFTCSIPGHAEAGMKGMIMVGTAAAGGTGGADDHGGPAPLADVQPDPNAPPYTLYDATAPKALEGETHDIDLVVEEKDMTVAKDFVQHVWTFNGTVPGPAIRVHVGDTIRIHLKNPATNQLSHSVDFHASQVAWNDEMTSIKPGEEKLYEWRADYAGVWMYHCGTAPTLHHIANGMYGMVIVEPKEGLPPVDHEFALVQSEWYLGPQGEPVSLTKAASGAPAPDYVVFNGVANQYKDNPLKVDTGKRVRIFVLNAGPSIDSSFHIVGTIFDTVIKEGVALMPKNAGNYGSQAVDLAPAQGAIIEFTTAEDGLYPVVTHAFNFVGRGALGLVQAGDGDPKK